MKELVDDNDATQTAWAKEEVISLKEYLQYCIAMNWIDVSKLDLNDKYSDSTKVYTFFYITIFVYILFILII